MTTEAKPERRLFVIMPFVQAGERNAALLTSFFENNLKRAIENADLAYAYRVYRSGQSFNITAEIIRDLARADVVIADLSGDPPNPNVMYELGIRLAVSERPVLLIREKPASGQRVFDVYGYYTFEYDARDYPPLVEHLTAKIARLERGEETFENPVLAIVREQLALLGPDPADVSRERQKELVLRGIRAVADAVERAFGPFGQGLVVHTPGGHSILEKSGVEIARGVRPGNPFEAQGAGSMVSAAEQMKADLGDGTKLTVILARAFIEHGSAAIRSGGVRREVLQGMEAARRKVVAILRERAFPSTALLSEVALTAAKDRSLDPPIMRVISNSGPDDLVRVPEGLPGPPVVETVRHFEFDRGAVSADFLAEAGNEKCVLDDCFVLVYGHNINTMAELLPILEKVAATGKPLLLVADNIEGEALATLLLNFQRGRLRCVPVRLPRLADRRAGFLDDLATYTGAQALTLERGWTLQSIGLAELGRARQVTVGKDWTTIAGGNGSADAIARRAAALRAAIAESVSDFDRNQFRERLARLVGQIFTIRAGGNTPQEVRDRSYLTSTALLAVLAARRNGCTTGGGSALVHHSHALRAEGAAEAWNHGFEAALLALQAPLRVLVRNREGDPDAVVAKITGRPERYGFDAEQGIVCDLVEAGVVDPVQVVARAVEIGFSSAMSFLESGAWSVGA